MRPDGARALLVLFLFAATVHGAPDYLLRLGPAPLRLAAAPPAPAASLPPLPPPPVEPDIPIQPPPAPTPTRVDSANPDEFMGPREFVGPTPPAAAPVVLALPVSPAIPGVRLGLAQTFTSFFANVSTNAPPTTLLAPLGFTPPTAGPPASSRAVYEKTP